ncbi:MAG TPA: YegP family protein [Chitinophaga sp.]|uniref:YegP family protein n=1 Tax=Chitinophaga sp. TaxID=1869181 RepID=UPI002BB469E4|nr:YegP family protein [Chitinophaga sp.]HVI49210.1 YegP family protein [Chitinophaga sp.]
MGKFHVKTAKDEQTYFVLKANNGETILNSEMYKTRQGCDNGIASVKANASDIGNYEKLTAKNGKYYFNLKAANHQVIGTSELYETTSGRDGGIESVRSNAPNAEVVED